MKELKEDKKKLEQEILELINKFEKNMNVMCVMLI